MAESALAKKMKLTPGLQAAIIHAPEGYLKELRPLPGGVKMSDTLTGQHDWVQVFVKNRAEVDAIVPRVVRALKSSGLLWISFPKGTSGIQTDLTRDQGWFR